MTKPISTQSALTEADKLERTLARLIAAEKRKLKNENILYLEKNGDIGYESIRTTREPVVSCGLRGVPPAADNATPNLLPETPSALENGQLIDAPAASSLPDLPQTPLAEVIVPDAVTGDGGPQPSAAQIAPGAGISEHGACGTGQQSPANDGSDPLDELLTRALSRPKRGRPATFDERAKGQIVALLSLGMSLRQAASVLGVSHNTIRNTIQADPALAEEITAARFQAQLQPLACVIREARRSWKAATWLLKYLDSKIASHEETPDERRDRQQRESDEFFARSTPGIKKRKA